MPALRPLRSARERFNQLAAAVAETRELTRQTAVQTQALLGDLTIARGDLAAESERRAEVASELAALHARVQQLGGELHELRLAQPAQAQFQMDVLGSLRRVHADEAWHRRRLRELRRADDYELAFTDPDPLVSVLIPTYTRLELLRSRTIPSILAQEHKNVEIVIVGDHASFGTADVTAGFERARIRFANLTIRGPYPDSPQRRWLVAGSPPFNEAMAMAEGLWHAPFADDDAMRPRHISLLLDAARRDRLEFVYARIAVHEETGDRVIGSFPPKHGDVGLQSALLHSGLSMFELELADSELGVPNDWSRIERMLRAGVRVGMVDEVLADYYPGLLIQESAECAGEE